MKSMSNSTEAGFALLYALIIISLVLGMAWTIVGMSLKEAKISTISNKSALAYYAAQSGAECYLYWHLKGVPFDGTSASDINCNDTILDDVDLNDPRQINLNYNACAVVEVTDSGSDLLIRSTGYNTCAANKLKTQRIIELRISSS